MAIFEEQKKKTTMSQRYIQSRIMRGKENDEGSLYYVGPCVVLWLLVSLRKPESAPIGYYNELR